MCIHFISNWIKCYLLFHEKIMQAQNESLKSYMDLYLKLNLF